MMDCGLPSDDGQSRLADASNAAVAADHPPILLCTLWVINLSYIEGLAVGMAARFQSCC